MVWHQLISPHSEILAWKQEQIKWGWKFFLSEWLGGWEKRSLKGMCDSWSTMLLLFSVCEGESFQGGDIKKGVVQSQPPWYPNPSISPCCVCSFSFVMEQMKIQVQISWVGQSTISTPTPLKISRARSNPNPNQSSVTHLLTHHYFPSYFIETNRFFTT